MSRIEQITYKDRQILSIDHSNLSEEELIRNMRAATKVMLGHESGGLLCLMNFEGLFMTDRVNEEIRSEEGLQAVDKAKKTALLGITGIKKIFLNAYNQMTGKQIKAFNSRAEALEYLVAE